MSGRLPRVEYRRALQIMRDRLKSAGFPPGKALPTSRALASDLGIGRNTLRRVIVALQEEGILDVDRRVAGTPEQVLVAPEIGATVLVVDELPVLDPLRMGRPGWLERILHASRITLAAKGFSVLSMHPKRLLDLPAMAPGGLCGIIIGWGGGGEIDLDRLFGNLRKLGVPIVASGEEAVMRTVDRVSSDHRQGASLATSWLLNRGRRRILPFLPLQRQWQRDRLAGYQATMEAAGFRPLAPITADHPDIGDEASFSFWTKRMSEEIRRRSEDGIDAVLALSDFEIPLLAESLKQLGLKPNHDVDIVGYDNVWPEVTSRRFSAIPPLATIDKRNDRQGEALVEMLVNRLSGHLPAEPQQFAIAPVLVEMA